MCCYIPHMVFNILITIFNITSFLYKPACLILQILTYSKVVSELHEKLARWVTGSYFTKN